MSILSNYFQENSRVFADSYAMLRHSIFLVMFGVNISIMEELDNIKTLLALLCAIDWLANDLHYRSEGTGFYEKHLLADRIRDFGDAED